MIDYTGNGVYYMIYYIGRRGAISIELTDKDKDKNRDGDRDSDSDRNRDNS